MKQENYTNINIFKKTYEEREVSTTTNVLANPSYQLKGNREHASQFNPYVNN
jgi:hypothetical protein